VRNARLEAALVAQIAEAERLCLASGKPARVFRDFRYRTVDSWSCERRVVGKAEQTLQGANPRFVVTSLQSKDFPDGRAFYEDPTAPAVRPRTASASSSNCLLIAPPRPPWQPTS
jgi:hypothetical protein